MTTIHFKSPDEHTVGSIRASDRKRMPVLPDEYRLDGYVVIDEQEFHRLKTRIIRNMLRPEPERIEYPAIV